MAVGKNALFADIFISMKRSALSALFASTLLFFSLSFCFGETVHVIQKGDTLYALARKYGVSVDEICAYNGISNQAKIKIGQSITIPEKGSLAKASEPAYREYLVSSGDTLFGIARSFETTVDEIRKANNLSEKSTLKIGQRLLIPSKNSAVASTGSTNSSSSASSASANSGTMLAQVVVSTETTPISDPRNYKVKNVDSKTVWPVKATELSYVSGKTNSVLLSGSKGEKVTAVKAGKVIFSGLYRGFGQVVFVQPKSSDYVYVYSGLDSIAVRKGDSVECGATLGTLGIDTISKKPQLNFMVFKNGAAVDPASAPRG